ncbi:MAG: hypothetical protein ATN33_08030, partial [Epulopiscium sp. Nele67-Bin001]
NPKIRKQILDWASEIATCFEGAINGDKKSFEKFEKLRKKPVGDTNPKYNPFRLALIMIYVKFPEIDVYNDIEHVYNLGGAFAKKYFNDMTDIICSVHGFLQPKVTKNKSAKKDADKKIPYEELLKLNKQLEVQNSRLEHELKTTNIMLEELQDEFEIQLEESKVEELTKFFSKLNSEKYGYLLDELLVIRKEVRALRKSNYSLPIELNGLLIMVDKLTMFIQDSQIDPIMKVDAIKKVTLNDIEFCNYDGEPFINSDDLKTVKVVSAGWKYTAKEIQISRPAVKEVITNE